MKKSAPAALGLLLVLVAACSAFAAEVRAERGDILQVIDAKTAHGVDENLMPVKPTDSFPQGTSKVFYWFQWQDALVNAQLTARWQYLTDDIHILDYNFVVPRKEGSGSISLSMPEGNPLPSGLYMVELLFKEYTVSLLTFRVD